MSKATAKEPFLPMFVGDFMAATGEWEGEEQAIYALLLMHQWAIGTLPTEVTKLARLIRWDIRNFEKYWPVVSSKFVERDGRLVNIRLEEHRAKSRAISEKRSNIGKLGAEAKWQTDGNSHAGGVANASGEDGKSHDFANGKRNAIHPIPSHPIHSKSSHSVAEDNTLELGSAGADAPGRSASRVQPVTDPRVGRVFEHWKATHNHPRAQLDPKRRKVIVHALKTYAEADLCQAISGYLNSPHHMGENERNTRYDDLELFLRDAKHIDAGLRYHAEPPRTSLSEKSRRIVAQTEDWVPPEERHASQ